MLVFSITYPTVSLIVDEVRIVHRALCIASIVDSSSLSQPKDQKSSMSQGGIWKGREAIFFDQWMMVWS